jgi:hypothetical protein
VIDGGVVLQNPAQHLAARFGTAGVAIVAGAGTVRMTLGGYGRGASLIRIGASPPHASANEVSIEHGPVREWYSNGPLGIEQSFEVTGRPAGSGQAVLALNLSSTLRLRLIDGGRDAVFGHGPGAVTYAGLGVRDAAGQSVPARLALAPGRLLIRIDDHGAAYPLTVDPTFSQGAHLTGSDTAWPDSLGYSVAVSGDTIVAGAPNETIGGNSYQGAVYVFTRAASGWADATETAKLTASDGVQQNDLGFSVAISGNTIVAGAPTATSGGVMYGGKAYVFVRPAGGWVSGTQTAELTATDPVYLDEFGSSVAIVGGTILAGAPVHTVDEQYEAGAVYVFSKPAGRWRSATQTAELTSSPVAGALLGTSVALSPDGQTVVGGASLTNAAYVFTEPAGGWQDATQAATLTPTDSGYIEFGLAVATSGSAIAVVRRTRPSVPTRTRERYTCTPSRRAGGRMAPRRPR